MGVAKSVSPKLASAGHVIKPRQCFNMTFILQFFGLFNSSPIIGQAAVPSIIAAVIVVIGWVTNSIANRFQIGSGQCKAWMDF